MCHKTIKIAQSVENIWVRMISDEEGKKKFTEGRGFKRLM